MRRTRRSLLVLLAWGWQLLVALLAGSIVASRVGAVYGQHPLGDRVLWRDGGLELLDLAVHAQRELGSLAVAVGAVVGLGTLLAVWPYALLLEDAARPRARRLVDLARAATRSLPTLLALRFLFLAGAVLVVGAAFFASRLGQALGTLGAGDRASDVRVDVSGGIAALIVVLALVPLDLGIDACAAAVVRERRPSLRLALLRGHELLRRDGVRLLGAWMWRALTGVTLVAGGALVASRLGGRGGAALLGLALVHQLIALARCALRASWLTVAVKRARSATEGAPGAPDRGI